MATETAAPAQAQHPTDPIIRDRLYVGGAWVDANAFNGCTSYGVTTSVAPVNVGRYIQADSAYNCVNWTSASATADGAVVFSGTAGTPTCNVARPIACCL